MQWYVTKHNVQSRIPSFFDLYSKSKVLFSLSVAMDSPQGGDYIFPGVSRGKKIVSGDRLLTFIQVSYVVVSDKTQCSITNPKFFYLFFKIKSSLFCVCCYRPTPRRRRSTSERCQNSQTRFKMISIFTSRWYQVKNS